MYYEKLIVVDCEFQNESYYRTLYREDRTAFDAEESAFYELITRHGRVVSTGVCQKSVDSTAFELRVPDTATGSLLGPYLLLVYLKDSRDPRIKDVIAEYRIEYTKKEAI